LSIGTSVDWNAIGAAALIIKGKSNWHFSIGNWQLAIGNEYISVAHYETLNTRGFLSQVI
jgi:hypothetical protein